MSHAVPIRNETDLLLTGNATGDAIVLGVPLAWVETHRASSLLIAFGCCVVATLLSACNIYQHLQHYSRPQLQRYIVRILAIVPVYAFGSLLSLVFVNQALYFDTFRDCYEAFVVYSFLALVLSFAGGESVCVLKMQSEPDITHAWPLSKCLHPIGRDGRLLRSCKRATIQFVLIKPVFALLSLVMLACGQYHTFAYQLVLAVVYNVSYSLALYGLWLFYLATKHILTHFNPVLKFFAVKSVVFLTFWQSGLIDLAPGISNAQRFAWKDFVLCLEMVPFALLHYVAFSPTQFMRQNLDRLPDSEVLKNMKEVLSLADLVADAYHNFMPSYQEYMLQRGESMTGRQSRGNGRRTQRQSKRVVVFGTDDDATTASGASSSASERSCSPTPMAVNNHHVPRFVIDDESEEESDGEEMEKIGKNDDLEAGGRSDNESADAIDATTKKKRAVVVASAKRRRFFADDSDDDDDAKERDSSSRKTTLAGDVESDTRPSDAATNDATSAVETTTASDLETGIASS